MEASDYTRSLSSFNTHQLSTTNYILLTTGGFKACTSTCHWQLPHSYLDFLSCPMSKSTISAKWQVQSNIHALSPFLFFFCIPQYNHSDMGCTSGIEQWDALNLWGGTSIYLQQLQSKHHKGCRKRPEGMSSALLLRAKLMHLIYPREMRI